jgi:hypothetical protein
MAISMQQALGELTAAFAGVSVKSREVGGVAAASCVEVFCC